MTLNEYTEKALETAKYDTMEKALICGILGLVGESGKLADKLKKTIRVKDGFLDFISDITDFNKEVMTKNKYIPYKFDQLSAKNGLFITSEEVAKELGDILWYINELGNLFGYTLEEIAEMNIKKLEDRNNRGVIQSEGDNR